MQTPLGHSTTFSYNANGQVTQVTDPLTHSTQYGRDDMNRVTSMTDANGNTTSYTYDFNGNEILAAESAEDLAEPI